MRWFVAVLILLSLPAHGLFGFFKPKQPAYELQVGDIVFQATGSQQCEAIRAATGSPYSHCGVVFKSDGKLFVLEAVSPVRATPLDQFKQRSLPGTYHAKRLKQADKVLSRQHLDAAVGWARENIGKPYDFQFLWGDDQLYCSELVWKLYRHSGGVLLVEPRRFSSYNTEPQIVRDLIIQRFGSLENFPANELVVAPHDIFASPLLAEVPRKGRKK